MADPPRLQVNNLPSMTPTETSATTSPARGAEMRDFLQQRLQKNRAPPLVHSWDFWHDRATPAHTTNNTNPTHGEGVNYEERLEVLANVDDVRKFWNVFNNFDTSRLQLRDSVHLFHKGIKPVWEDARNARGGSWTFRVPKDKATEFWKEVCMMAIGEQLQAAIESDRTTFRDDICGINLGVRFNSMLVQIWNRDGDHKEGVDKILKTVLENLSESLRPREGSYYYKKHSEHSGFTGPADKKASEATTVAGSTNDEPSTAQPRSVGGGEEGMQSLNAILDKET